MTAGATNTSVYAYDLAGNRTNKLLVASAVATDTNTITYLFDVPNRLVTVVDGTISGTNAVVTNTTFNASYDYRTRRLRKTELSGTGLSTTNATYFRYDSGDSFQELSSGTNGSI
ncbi:MAG: hypothetical protein EXS18_01100 [Verrucomicrobiae bacterium]|nr:hypothetical protein [Verrucomicrobiae bacterium]